MFAATPTNSKVTPSQNQTTNKPEIDEFASKLIRCKAKRLIRRAGFSPSDREDIEQELTMMLLQRMQKFNPKLANYHSFVITVIQQSVVTLLNHHHALRRSHRRVGGSLNQTVDNGAGNKVELQAALTDGQQKHHTGQQIRSDEEMVDLVLDVAQVIADLPPSLRIICEGLKHGCTSEVARSTGLGRAIYPPMKRVRNRFEKAGLRDYM